MPGDVTPRGLCTTCRSASSCTYPREPSRPVFFCEEFDMRGGEAPSTISGADALPLGQPPRAPVSEGDDCARYKGLCGNCDNRESCTFPRPEGGVWYCEEYQ